MYFFISSEFKCITEGRNYRYDPYGHSVIGERLFSLQCPAVYFGRNRIRPAVCIIDTEVPDAGIASFRGLDEVHTDIKSMVIRQFDIIWLGLDIIAISRLMSSHGHPVAAVPVPCTVYLKTLSELMLCYEGKLMTVVVPVAIPCMEEIFEISLVP